MKLKANIYIETEFRGATVSYITTQDGVVMIDSPYKPSDAVNWRKEIECKGQVKYLINTESHGDHYAGNAFFDVPVISHAKAREEIIARDANQLIKILTDIDPDSIDLLSNYEVKLPSITFCDQFTLYMGSHTFHLIHLPGHTPGQIAVFIPEERVVFTGDNICGKVQTFFQEAEPFAWLTSLKRINELEVDYLIPGHGEICQKSYIKDQESYVQECIHAVRASIKQGLTREEAVAKTSLPSRYPLERGQEKAGPRLLQMSVSHLYDVLSSSSQ